MNPSELDLEASLLSSATDVLESMYFTSVTGASAGSIPGPGLAARLEFRGELSGEFLLRMNLETARLLAANFFGEEESAVSETAIEDTVGELANMICGSVLSRMETESHFKLSHPSVARAEDLAQGMENGVHRLLETDSGGLALCLTTQ
jgi:CheY-specific phosphatase CheX